MHSKTHESKARHFIFLDKRVGNIFLQLFVGQQDKKFAWGKRQSDECLDKEKSF